MPLSAARGALGPPVRTRRQEWRPYLDAAGGVAVSSSPPAAAAELTRWTAGARGMRLEGVVRNAPADLHSLSVLAVRREDERQVAVPAVRKGDRFRVEIPVRPLLRLAPLRWGTLDLYLRLETPTQPAQVRLRQADPSLPLPDALHALYRERWRPPRGRLDAELYFTERGNASLRIRPVPLPGDTRQEPRSPAPLAVRRLVERWCARSSGRTRSPGAGARHCRRADPASTSSSAACTAWVGPSGRS